MTRKLKLTACPYGHKSLIAFYEDKGYTQKLYMVKNRSSALLINKNTVNYEALSKPISDKYDLKIIRDYFACYNNEYLKDVKWVVVKVKPPIYEGLHRFNLIETESGTRKAMQSMADTKNKNRNAFDSFYCTAIIGTRMNRQHWMQESLPEEPRHKIMRKILKQPAIWRSYPNLYPKAKVSVPYFNASGDSLSPDRVLPELRPPSIKAIPNNLAYAMVSLSYGTILPTFNSPKVRGWSEHGYRMVA